MILCEAVPRIRIECAPSRALVHSYSAVSKIKCLNSGARRCTMFLSVAAFSGTHLSKNKDNCFYLSVSGDTTERR